MEPGLSGGNLEADAWEAGVDLRRNRGDEAARVSEKAVTLTPPSDTSRIEIIDQGKSRDESTHNRAPLTPIALCRADS